MNSLRSLSFTDEQINEMATIDRSPRSEFISRDRVPDFLAKRYGRPTGEVEAALDHIHDSTAFDAFTAFSPLRVKLSTEFLLWQTINEHSAEELAMANKGRSKRQRLLAVKTKTTRDDELLATIETLESKLTNETKAREAAERGETLSKEDAAKWRDCFEQTADTLFKLTQSTDALKEDLAQATKMVDEARADADHWKAMHDSAWTRGDEWMAEAKDLRMLRRTHEAYKKEREESDKRMEEEQAIIARQDEENVIELKKKISDARSAEDRFRYKLGLEEARVLELEGELQRLRHQPPETATVIFHENPRTRKTVLLTVPPTKTELLGVFEGYEQINFREAASSGHFERLVAPGSVNTYVSFVTSATQWANIYVPACGRYQNNGMDHFLCQQFDGLTTLLRDAGMRFPPEPRAFYEEGEIAWLIASPPFDDPHLKYAKLRCPRARVNMWACLLAFQCAWSIFPYEEYTHPGSITRWIFGPSPAGARPTREALSYTIDVIGRAWDILASQPSIE